MNGRSTLPRRRPRVGSGALVPVGGARAPHCSIPAASRAELASCRSPSAASRSERQRGVPGRAASTCRRSHPRSQPSGWETPPADCAAQRGRVSGPGEPLPNLPGDRGSPGPGECEQVSNARAQVALSGRPPADPSEPLRAWPLGRSSRCLGPPRRGWGSPRG